MPTLETAAIVGGGLLGNLGELFQDAPQQGESLITSLNLRNDPLNTALAFDALMSLGNIEGAEAVLQRGNPMNQLMERVNASPGLSLFQKNAASTVLKHIYETGGYPAITPANREMLTLANAAFGTAGIGNNELAQLPQAKTAFDSRIKSMVETASTADVFGGRTSALRQLSSRIKSMEGGGPGSFGALTDVAGNTLRGNLQDVYDQRRRDALAAANAGGYNPAGILGDLEKQFLRESAAMPLQANQLAATLAANEDRDFQNLLAYLTQGSNTATQSAQVANQAAIGSAGIAANQMAAANSARQAQSNTTGDFLDSIGSTVQLAGLLGGGGSKPGATTQRTPISSSPGPWADGFVFG